MSSETQGGSGAASLPEYEVSQYFPREPEFTDQQRREIKDEYGYIRAYFKMRPDHHRDLQKWLNQARFGDTYDRYLTRALYYSLGVAFIGFLLGVVVSFWLSGMGLLGTLTSPVPVYGDLVDFVSANRVWFATGLIAIISMVLFGGGTWAFMYYYPREIANSRRRSIDFILPNAIVYMYALSYGGMNLIEVIGKLADADDAYGAVAEEFDMVRRDMEMFGNDMYTSLRNARNLTPSDNLEQFIDDMISVLESGGEITGFFEEQSNHYLRRAKEEQEDFLETLSILSEVFIVGFVAAPLFLIVILMIISVLGGNTLTQLYVLIYAGLPLGMLAFMVLVSTLSEPYTYPDMRLEIDEAEYSDVDEEDLEDDQQYLAYQRSKRWDPVKEFLDDPMERITQQPLYTLALTLPVAALVIAAVFLTGQLPTSPTAWLDTPLMATYYLFVYPFFITMVPLALFYEIQRSRNNEIAQRFPDTLNILSSANNMGIPLTEALDIVARWSPGRYADQLRTVRNDIRWTHDTTQSLLRFANRLGVPQLSRTIKLIAEGSQSTSDLSEVLSIAAEDTRNRYRLSRERAREMTSYIAVVIIGFLVYLLVIVLLDTSYLTPISQVAEQSEELANTPIGITNIPAETYRMLFFHSVLIQAIGSGLLTGLLTDNKLLTGLKYSILLSAIAYFVFVLV